MMSGSPFVIDHPSPPLPTSPQSHRSTEAFPDFPSSLLPQSSPASAHRAQPNSHLEVPGAQLQSQRPNRPFRSSSQRLPPTALLPSGRNVSHNDLNSATTDHNRDREEQPQQKLPRAIPAPSLSGPSVRPSLAPGLARGSVNRIQSNAEELKSESLWADMQRTLADVELSAMKSSHLFNAPHSQALEKLRETQVALAQAWARSEADETAGQESEDEYLQSDSELDIRPSALGPRAGASDGWNTAKGLKGKGGKDPGPKPNEKRDRQGSTGSNTVRNLEQETERDIKFARKRREANDHYFSQVNRGVLDVVARLDEVASAIRTVEQESRAVWEEMEGSGSTTASGTELDNDTDPEEYKPSPLAKNVATTTSNSGPGAGSGTEASDSPTSYKALSKPSVQPQSEMAKDAKKSINEKGR